MLSSLADKLFPIPYMWFLRCCGSAATPLCPLRLRLPILRSNGCSSPVDTAKDPLLLPVLLLVFGRFVGEGGVSLVSLGFVVRSNGDSADVPRGPGPLDIILCSCSRGDLGSVLKNMLGLSPPRSGLNG